MTGTDAWRYLDWAYICNQCDDIYLLYDKTENSKKIVKRQPFSKWIFNDDNICKLESIIFNWWSRLPVSTKVLYITNRLCTLETATHILKQSLDYYNSNIIDEN